MKESRSKKYKSAYMEYLKQLDSQEEKAAFWLPGPGGGSHKKSLFSLGVMKIF